MLDLWGCLRKYEMGSLGGSKRSCEGDDEMTR